MLRLGLFVIACGYEGGEDCDVVRGDPLFKLAVGRVPVSGHDLSSQPTVSQPEKAASRSEAAGMRVALVDIFCCSLPDPLVATMLDIDDTCDSVHGHRRLAKLARLT